MPLLGSILEDLCLAIRIIEGLKMTVLPFKFWEDMKRWKEEQIQKPRLPPDPNVSATASLQRDLPLVMAYGDISEAEKSKLFGQSDFT